MQKTTPNFIQADNLSIKQGFKRMSKTNYLLYSSLWKWWSKTTIMWGIPLLIGGILIFIAMLYSELTSKSNMGWLGIVMMSLIPLIFMLPFIWMLSFYYSIWTPIKIKKSINKLIKTYIPDATNLTRYTPTNFTFQRNGIKYELDYTHVFRISSRRVRLSNVGYFLICLYYAPKPGTDELWYDEYGNMKDSYFQSFDDYCAGKNNCKYLFLTRDAMCALFTKKECKKMDDVTNILNELEYLLSKFNMIPQ